MKDRKHEKREKKLERREKKTVNCTSKKEEERGKEGEKKNKNKNTTFIHNQSPKLAPFSIYPSFHTQTVERIHEELLSLLATTCVHVS